MKRFAEDEETIVIVPDVLKPIRIQLALIAVPVEVRDIAIAVGIRERASYCAEAIKITTLRDFD